MEANNFVEIILSNERNAVLRLQLSGNSFDEGAWPRVEGVTPISTVALESSEGRSRDAWMGPSQFFHPFEHPCCLTGDLFAHLATPALIGRFLKLAAPQDVSGFRVRLNFHRTAPFPGFLLFRSPLILVGLPEKPSNQPPHTAKPACTFVLIFIESLPVLDSY